MPIFRDFSCEIDDSEATALMDMGCHEDGDEPPCGMALILHAQTKCGSHHNDQGSCEGYYLCKWLPQDDQVCADLPLPC